MGQARVVVPSFAAVGGLGENDMLKWALIFAVVALIAGGLGFYGIAGAAAGIAKFLFFLFLAACAVFAILGFTVARKISGPRS